MYQLYILTVLFFSHNHDFVHKKTNIYYIVQGSQALLNA